MIFIEIVLFLILCALAPTLAFWLVAIPVMFLGAIWIFAITSDITKK